MCRLIMSPLHTEIVNTKRRVRGQIRTSSLALALQVSAAAIKIIPVATAVFAFQFLGCPHQPPGEQNRARGDTLARQPVRIRKCETKADLMGSKPLSEKDTAFRLP